MKNDGQSPDVAEARRAPRKTLRTLAEIVCEGRDTAVECTVLDLSTSGARLKLNSATRRAFTPDVALPETFVLRVPRDMIQMDCRLAWRDGDLVGVAFASGFRPLKRTT